jgi:hypothetical protein
MKVARIIVPIVLSLIATLIAVGVTRFIRRADVDGELEPLAEEWAAAPVG